MKILMVVEAHVKGAGGGPMYWAQLSEHLVRRGHQVQILSGFKPDSEFVSPNTVGLIPIRGDLRSRSGWTLLSRYWFRKRFVPVVRTFVEQWQPDIIHTVPPIASEAALRAGVALDIPVVASILSHVEAQWSQLEPNWLRAYLFRQLELRAIHRPFRRIICLTRRSQQVLQAEGIPEARIVYVPHAVDTEKFGSKAVARFRTQLALSDETFVIGYAGVLSREKGTFQLFEAMARLANLHNLALLVAGEPLPSRRRPLALRKAFRNVYFLGRVEHEDMPAFMASLDLFIIPSWTETLPTTLLEALATGVPVMASAVGGIKEFLKNRLGIILPSLRTEDIVQGLNAWMPRREDLEAMGQAGQRYVREHHNWKRTSELTEGVYQACLKG
ncbi:MAG: glycosyltransferase family 4 protein [Promethearchaeota archaeon]